MFEHRLEKVIKNLVCEGLNEELREGSLISDHKTLNFDRGLDFEPNLNAALDPNNPNKSCQNGAKRAARNYPNTRLG